MEARVKKKLIKDGVPLSETTPCNSWGVTFHVCVALREEWYTMLLILPFRLCIGKRKSDIVPNEVAVKFTGSAIPSYLLFTIFLVPI
ncbi:hypothetical protein L2E82_19419 [Cichorium intybus]|uniref:Uncharacterized protein n=1 Tax=Cichorium intybus TaxID=13427 RepID=A0ACB9FC73_CICIN|nr:hypothetical protein L2E82_19419 [Cichorium intybus]